MILAAAPNKPAPTLNYSCFSTSAGTCHEGFVDFVAANLPRDVDVVIDGDVGNPIRLIARRGDLTFQLQFVLPPLTISELHVVDIYDGGGENAGALLASTSFTTVELPQ